VSFKAVNREEAAQAAEDETLTRSSNKKDNAKDREEHQPAHLQSEFAHGDQFDQTEPSLTIGLNALHARNAANFNAADIKLTPNPLPISPWRAG